MCEQKPLIDVFEKLETYLATNAQVLFWHTGFFANWQHINIFKAKVWRSCKLYTTFTP